MPCVVPEDVFDAFSWCQSDVLYWGHPEGQFDVTTPVDGSDPARMVFILRDDVDFLPKELAMLHAFKMGFSTEWALAPYAIDDATDNLYEKNIRPASVMWLSADNLNALFWGLHDWVHFHNHGPFEQRAWTEFQCDTTALHWLWLNRDRIELSRKRWLSLREEVLNLCARRFKDEYAGRRHNPVW